jgi:hypothetical protein
MRQIKDKLEARQGIHEVSINETTGSVRVNYDRGRHDMEGILHVMEDFDVILCDYMPGIDPVGGLSGGGSQGTSALPEALEDLSKRLSAAIHVPLDLKTVLPLGFLTAGLWSIARNGLMMTNIPGWVFIWLAFDTYMKLHIGAAVSRPAPMQTPG